MKKRRITPKRRRPGPAPGSAAKVDRIYIQAREIINLCARLASAAKKMKGRTMSDEAFRNGVKATTDTIGQWVRRAVREQNDQADPRHD